MIEIENEQLKLRLFHMQMQIDGLKRQNDMLKFYIEQWALMEKPSKWTFYHDHKHEIKNTYGIENWRDVKKKSDEIYNRINK